MSSQISFVSYWGPVYHFRSQNIVGVKFYNSDVHHVPECHDLHNCHLDSMFMTNEGPPTHWTLWTNQRPAYGSHDLYWPNRSKDFYGGWVSYVWQCDIWSNIHKTLFLSTFLLTVMMNSRHSCLSCFSRQYLTILKVLPIQFQNPCHLFFSDCHLAAVDQQWTKVREK